MYYVGIDPSSNTGLVILDEDMYVVFEECISIEEENKYKKADIIANEVVSNIIDCTDSVYRIKVCIEGFSYGSKGKSVDFQYGLGYLIRQKLILYDIDYTEIPPSTLKRFAAGKGNVSKDVVMREVYKKWGYENNDNNIVDAYVLARMAAEK